MNIVKLNDITKLREETQAPIMECKKALAKSKGDFKKAAEILRERGHKIAQKRADKESKQGLIESYIHGGGKIGVLLEINCETDFVASNAEFKTLAHNLAMQIAATNPLAIRLEDVPAEIPPEERENAALLSQPFIKNPEIKVNDLIAELVSKTGEKIEVKRFVRYQLGE